MVRRTGSQSVSASRQSVSHSSNVPSANRMPLITGSCSVQFCWINLVKVLGVAVMLGSLSAAVISADGRGDVFGGIYGLEGKWFGKAFRQPARLQVHPFLHIAQIAGRRW